MKVIKTVNGMKLDTLTRKTVRTMREMTEDKRNKQLNNGRKFFRLCLVTMSLLLTIFSVNVFAGKPPNTTTITAPLSSETITAVPYTVTGECTDDSGGTANIDTITVDDGSGAQLADISSLPNYSYSWGPSDGTYTLTVVCTELDGDSKTATATGVVVSTAVGGPDVLSVDANTAVANAATAGDTGVQMQYLQVGCTAGGADDGNCVMTTVTLNDQGTAGAAGMIDNLRIYLDNDNDFGNGTIDNTLVSAWDGTSTGVDISGLTGNSIADGGTGYIWIVYDINSAADSQTIQNQVTAIAVSGGDTGATGTWSSNNFSIAASGGGGPADCQICHTYPPGDGTRALATGNVVGDHGPHVTTFGMICNDCHVDSGAYAKNHRNLNIEMKDVIEGGWYDKDNDGTDESPGTDATFAQVKNPTLSNCNNTNCHGAGAGPTWGTTTKVGAGCTLCHNNGTDDGAAANAYPTSTFRTADAVGLHATHLTGAGVTAITTAITCDDCHVVPATIDAAGHIDTAADRANDADPTFPTGSGARLGSTTPTYTNASQTCSVYCHGANLPSGSTDGVNETPTWADSFAATRDADNCSNACHGLPPSTGSHSGQTTSQCGGCHDSTMTNGSTGIADTSFHINGKIEGGSCEGCHSTGSGGAPIVVWPAGDATGKATAYGSHMKATTGDTLDLSTNWATQCKKCHGEHTGDVLIPNNATVGISYASHGGIYIGGTATTATNSEAEICWECHDAQSVSEWETNTHTVTGSSPYNYGSVSTSNWTSATWNSNNFTYKTAPIQSTHAATISTGGGTTTRSGVDDVKTIRCTYCHDVHDLNALASDTVSGSPYLRGSWIGNLYGEDGAPQAGTAYASQGSFGTVPRGGNGAQEYGGYFIDENALHSATPNPAGFAGLCDVCHGNDSGAFDATELASLSADQYGTGDAGAGWVSGLDGHAAAVKGGDVTGAPAARNIFSTKARNNNASVNLSYGTGGAYNGQPVMAYQNATGEAHGIRGEDTRAFATSTGQFQPGAGDQKYSYGDYNWLATVDVDLTATETIDENYHQFTCSKCHNPHASRLPRLMITNCLDTKHNTWDDVSASPYTVTLSPTTQQTDGNSVATYNQGKEWSNTSSAQNCHRVSDPNQSGAVSLPGWNKVTPWTDGDGDYNTTGDKTQDQTGSW